MSQENVENMLSSYTPTYIEEKDARCGGVEVFYGMTTGEWAVWKNVMPYEESPLGGIILKPRSSVMYGIGFTWWAF